MAIEFAHFLYNYDKHALKA